MRAVLRCAAGKQVIILTDSIECRGGSMWIPDMEQPIARYEKGYWLHRQMRCWTVECRSMLCVQFAGESGMVGPLLGPRTSVALRGPYVFAGREQVAKLAIQSAGWIHAATSKTWEILRITAASPTP